MAKRKNGEGTWGTKTLYINIDPKFLQILKSFER